MIANEKMSGRLLGALALGAVCACSPGEQRARAPDTPVAQEAQQRPANRPPQFAASPTPTYLPAGFSFLKEETQPPDGFHGTVPFGTDIEQTALIYWGPPYPGPDEGMRYPIKFIVTREHGHRLSGTTNREGTPHTIRFAEGTEATATYWDGMWAPPRVYDSTGKAVPPPRGAKPVWSREIFHALVYRWGDYTIGIRASHLSRVSLQELLKVAASTSPPK